MTESNRLHGVTGQEGDNLHTQHSENPEISHNYVMSKDFSSSAIAVNVLGQIKKLIGEFFPVPSMKAHIM